MGDGKLRPELGVLPSRMRQLPIDHRGYCVPWFVQWLNGEPEFRVMDGAKFVRAVRDKLCWVCGQPLGRHQVFAVGPMCVVNRTSAEPPCHHECAEWSARHCPFLSRPHMVRREDAVVNASLGGEAMLVRNPGVTALWATTSYTVFNAGRAAATGYLLEMGPPTRVAWFTEGRAAGRDEVVAALDSGMPLLEATCEQEPPAERPAAYAALRAARAAAEAWLP